MFDKTKLLTKEIKDKMIYKIEIYIAEDEVINEGIYVAENITSLKEMLRADYGKDLSGLVIIEIGMAFDDIKYGKIMNDFEEE